MKAWILALGLALASSACADVADRECIEALTQTPKALDWSSGEYRICSPISDAQGHRYPEDLEMTCRVYVDGIVVGTAQLRPGRLMRGPHGRTGTGIATGVCEVDGAAGQPAKPLEVKLS